MNSVADEIKFGHIGQNIICFTGQAGFIFKTKTEKVLGLDLYLSDCGERKYGFKRLMPKIISPQDIIFDAVLCSHEHYDHFDVDAIPLMVSNKKTTLVAAKDCKKLAERLELGNQDAIYLGEGDSCTVEDFNIKAVFCDHGKETPDAIGFIIEFDGIRVYYAGDTCLREDKKEEIKNYGPIDIMIAPINGAFGNMNECEMARYSSLIKPKLTIPCHYWNWAEHGGNPGLFMKEMDSKYPERQYLIMAQGEIHEVRR